MLASIAVGIVFVLAAPNVKVAALIVLASGTLMYARTKTYSVKSIGSRFTETDKILQKIDEDKFISSSGKRDLRSATEGCFDSYIRAMTQDDRLLRDQHVSQFRFQQENVLKILSRLDVSTGTNSEQYIDSLAAFTTVFDEMNEVLNRSKRAQRRAPESLDEKVAFTAYV